MDVNGEREGGNFSLDKDCLAGKFVLIQKTKDRKTGCVVGERMTNGVCIVNASNRKKTRKRLAGWGDKNGGVVNEMIFANKN